MMLGEREMDTEWLYKMDNSGDTPVGRISRSGRPELTRVAFLQQMRDDLAYVVKLPPLHRAAYWGYEDVVREILDRGADPNELDDDGETALHKAARLDNKEAAEVLIENGADVNLPSGLGLTALHWATLSGHEEIAELLVAHGASASSRDIVVGGMTPLDMARLLRHRELAQMLERHTSLW
jgi:serine/threonine-protein phosphatase 6 regulatory ankyrin repeat subunit B